MQSPKLRFRAPIEIRGINPYVAVSAERAARLKPDWRKPLPVRIQVNGKPDVPWRINMMPAGDGSFFLYLHERVRNESATGVGDVVSVTIVFDDAYSGGPLHPMPGWFGSALKRNPSARRGWNNLAPSRQKEILRYLVRLKSAQAQQRNLERALHVLAGGKARFMGRAWEAGR
ncbi:MAG: DUF1905 domain-containing protein [Xanthobacteraceae bacterium]|nr:DUF1905 domain-containing protein [Xanthobacteraceae bacterium]